MVRNQRQGGSAWREGGCGTINLATDWVLSWASTLSSDPGHSLQTVMEQTLLHGAGEEVCILLLSPIQITRPHEDAVGSTSPPRRQAAAGPGRLK